MKARQLLEVVTQSRERDLPFDTEMWRKGIRNELQRTGGDLEAAKEAAYQNLLADPQHYERHGHVRQRAGLPEQPPTRRYGEAKCPIKPPPKGELDPFEVAVGREVEKEHTTDPDTAEIIGKQHIGAPGGSGYYTKKLKKIEPDEVEAAIAKVKRQPLFKGKKLVMMALPPSTSTPSGMPG